MTEKEQPDNQRDYSLQAARIILEFGDTGEDIVRMVSAYIAEGWMDHGQAMMMLKDIFNKEADD